jgi:3-oxoacyl-[acyl-carrier-protein] synthase-3
MTGTSAIITGTGMSVPARVVTNPDLEAMVDTSDEWIVARTGIRERRIAGPEEVVSDHAAAAGMRALEAAGVPPEDVDLILLATVTPDMPIPASACTVQHLLGAKNAWAFDLQAGCSGFIYAQSVAKQFLLTGKSRHVLVIGAELLSKYLDWNDRATCVIFADGAGATLMSQGTPPRGVLASVMHTDGSMADFICMPGGGCRRPASAASLAEGLHFVKMRGNETFKIAVRSLEEVAREAMAQAGVTAADVAWFVPHQANRRIIDAVGERLGIGPERCYVNVDRFGNTSAASIPIALDEAVRSGKIAKDDLVLMAAFGAGLTWAASVVRW